MNLKKEPLFFNDKINKRFSVVQKPFWQKWYFYWQHEPQSPAFAAIRSLKAKVPNQHQLCKHTE